MKNGEQYEAVGESPGIGENSLGAFSAKLAVIVLTAIALFCERNKLLATRDGQKMPPHRVQLGWQGCLKLGMASSSPLCPDRKTLDISFSDDPTGRIMVARASNGARGFRGTDEDRCLV
jgi:hypothetical protein